MKDPCLLKLGKFYRHSTISDQKCRNPVLGSFLEFDGATEKTLKWNETFGRETMQKQHPLYIYDSREVTTLCLLAGVGGLFLFTLGLHTGKRLGMHPVIEISPTEGKSYPIVADKVPNRQELFEQGRNSGEVADRLLGTSLKAEVESNHLKLEVSRPTELPDEPSSRSAGATTLDRPGNPKSGGKSHPPSHSGH
jgi:hypothetical protein